MYALLIFVVALAVRLIHIWQLKGSPFFDTLLGDAHGYDLWAQRLAGGDWIGSEVFYQAPLYPYFLGVVYALFDRDLLIVRVAQALIGSASCALLGLAGARLFSRAAGLAAGLALALWAPAIFFDGLIQKSVLDMLFICLALWLVAGLDGAGRSRWLALGLTMGALALTRENALALAAVIALYAVLSPFDELPTNVQLTDRSSVDRSQNHRRTSAARLVAFTLGLGLMLLPVVARNYSIDGGLYLTTSQFGSNFYIGNNPNADGTYAPIRFGRGAPEFERLDAIEVAQDATGRTLSPAEVSSFWTKRAIAFITSQPGAWLALTGRKILLLFNRAEMIDTESLESHAEYSTLLWLLGWIGHFGLLVPLAVFGMIATWSERRRLWLLYGLFLVYAGSVVLFYVFARYRYPLVPFLVLFAAALVPQRLTPLLSRRRGLMTVAAVTAAAVFANVPLLSPTLMQAITENNLGTALQDQKQYDRAIPHHERAIALSPDYAPAYNNLGAALRGAGRLDEAIARYRQALELKPDFASASYNLANALLAQGNAAASAESFRRSLQSTPNSVEAQNNLGIALAAKGDRAGAVAAFRAALAIDARSVHAHRNLGNMLVDLGQRADGVAHLERAAALAPAEPEAVYDLGTILLQEQNFAAAAARFAAALQVRPDWAEAHNNLGIALASQGRIADALTHFERAVALKPALTSARANRDQARAALKK